LWQKQKNQDINLEGISIEIDNQYQCKLGIFYFFDRNKNPSSLIDLAWNLQKWL